eukprot:scaffold1473_cov375-Prasinococcus_capsulatus_cf.AAC.10
MARPCRWILSTCLFLLVTGGTVAAGDETTIDCEWYNALSDEQLEDYLTIFNLPWLDAQTLETQCAYVAAVKVGTEYFRRAYWSDNLATIAPEERD